MRAALFVILLGTVAACGFDDGPRKDIPRGTYALTSVNDGGLPFVMMDDPDVGRWVLHSDTIIVLGGGRAERRRVVEVTGNAHIGDTVMATPFETNYRLIDGRIEVGYFHCPINALCSPIPSGEVMRDGFSLDIGVVQLTGVGIFRRSR